MKQRSPQGGYIRGPDSCAPPDVSNCLIQGLESLIGSGQIQDAIRRADQTEGPVSSVILEPGDCPVQALEQRASRSWAAIVVVHKAPRRSSGAGSPPRSPLSSVDFIYRSPSGDQSGRADSPSSTLQNRTPPGAWGVLFNLLVNHLRFAAVANSE